MSLFILLYYIVKDFVTYLKKLLNNKFIYKQPIHSSFVTMSFIYIYANMQ